MKMKTIYIRRSLPRQNRRSGRGRERVGVLSFEKKGSTLYVGWSLCNRDMDRYDNEVGRAIAFGRLVEAKNPSEFPKNVVKLPFREVAKPSGGFDVEKMTEEGIPNTVATWLDFLYRVYPSNFEKVSSICTVRSSGNSGNSRKKSSRSSISITLV